MTFRRTMLKAIRESNLSRRDKRLLRFVALFRTEALREFVIEEAIEDSKIDPNAIGENIDWEALLAFLKELIPIILEIISMFL